MLKTNLNFTAGQLNLIRSCAEQCISDGTPSRISDEWAVFETVIICHGFSADQLVIMHLIAKQCEARRLGAMKVYECIVAFNQCYENEGLEEFPELVAAVVNIVAPETAPRVIYNDGAVDHIFVPLRIALGRDGMGPFSLN